MSTRCSSQSRAVGESMAGTAPQACAWIVLEHPGPWGARALEGTALPSEVAEHLRDGAGSGVGVLLARRPDARARLSELHTWIARSTPGGLLLREGVLTDYSDVLEWDLPAIGRGELPPFGAVSTQPIHFVCTNGARDQCCAIEGRALVAELCGSDAPGDLRERVWECSHIGGHRFAPVMLSLPAGTVHGRLTTAEARDVIDRGARGDILLDHYRGRSGLPAPLQAVAIEARRQFGLHGIDDIDVLRVVGERAVPVSACLTLDDSQITCEVRHHDGRAWRAVAERQTQSFERPESCDRDPVPVHSWRVTELTPQPPWT